MKHTLAVLVENHSGVLSKVAGLFSRRGFNIESLAVGITEDPKVSRMTIVVDGDEYIVEQVSKQLNKLIDIIKVWDISEDSVTREIALIKVYAPQTIRSKIIEITDIFRARVVDVNNSAMVIEITGDNSKIAAIEDVLRPFGILEMVRTGAISIERGNKQVRIPGQSTEREEE